MLTLMTILKFLIIFVYGAFIGCFANKLIDYFIEKVSDEDESKKHKLNLNDFTYNCGCRRNGIDSIPIIGFIKNKGYCNICGEKIHKRYLIVEVLMGMLFCIEMYVNTSFFIGFLSCLVIAGLVILSFVDFETYEIPVEINYFILAIGIIVTIFDYKNFLEHIIGLVLVSGFIYIIIYLSNGRAMGGGDCKLMATCGLLIGWKLILVAFIIGCILGSIVHSIRIKVSNEPKVLALGPYLAIGIYIAMIFGNNLLNMYMSLYK